MTTITINNKEHELKFGWKAHKELQSIIEKSGESPAEFLVNKNYPLFIMIELRNSIPEITIEQVEEAIEDMPFPEVMKLVQPYIKYYNPNGVSPTL
jgi:hypothetical protein